VKIYNLKEQMVHYKIHKALSKYLNDYNDGKQHCIYSIIATQYEWNRNVILQRKL